MSSSRLRRTAYSNTLYSFPAYDYYLHNGTTMIVTSERIRKASPLAVLSMPLSGSDYTQVIDAMGVIREVTIDGVIIDTLANIRTFILASEGLVNGDQNRTKTAEGYSYYTPTITNVEVKVKIESFDYTFEGGDPNKLHYTLKTVETSVVS